VDKVTFSASLWNIRIDQDGGARITMDVPHSSLGDVVLLSALTDVLLEVSVKLAKKEPASENGHEQDTTPA
jgi:hypothetical protein